MQVRTPEPDSRATEMVGPMRECPSCGARDFLVDEARGILGFRCQGCSIRWRFELGYVWRVGPHA